MSDELHFHPLAEIFPLMEGEEFGALVADIKAHGLQEYICLYDGKIIDGRNRYRACLAAGWTMEAIDEMCLPSEDYIDNERGGPAAFVISANIHRRHVTAEQKRDLIAAVLKANPEKSDRAIAKELGVSHPTVAKARASTGNSLPVDKRIGLDGKARKVKKRAARNGTPPRVNPEAANAYIRRALEFMTEFYSDITAWREQNQCLNSEDREALFRTLHQVGNTFSEIAQLFLPTPKEESAESNADEPEASADAEMEAAAPKPHAQAMIQDGCPPSLIRAS